MSKRRETENRIGTLQRELSLTRHWEEQRADGTGVDRLVELSFSSEEPYLRSGWDGDWVEILDHGKSSVRLDRIRTAGISLFNHDVDQPVAKPVKVWIEERRGRSILRFGSTARASEVWQLIDDGIITNVSVWYRIYKRELLVEEEGKPPVYRVTDWEPIELGPVSVPADATVGIGRGEAADEEYVCVTYGRQEEEDQMACQKCGKDPCACSNAPAVAVINRGEVVAEERKRTSDILAIGARHYEDVIAARAVAEGVSVDQFREQILERLEKRNTPPAGSQFGAPERPAALGMSRREVQGFGLLRLVRHLINPSSRAFAEQAAAELEACNAWAAIAGIREGGVAIPPDVWTVPRQAYGKRLVSVGTEGADMVGTTHVGASFIDVLRATRPFMAHATILGDLVGDLKIPKQTAAANATFKAEGTAGDETTPTYGNVSLSPNKVTAWVEYNKQALMQFSPDLDMLLRKDLFNAGLQRVESVLVDGGGTAEPDGILDLSGVGSVSCSDGGITWRAVTDLEGEVEADDALEGDLAYVTNPLVKAQMKRTEISTTSAGQFIWDRQTRESPVNGYPCYTSTRVPKTLGAGSNLSAAIFGDLASIILAIWAGVELLVNPYSKDKEGTIRMTLYHWVDFGFRHEESLAVCDDIDPTAS